jgi:hypothetical protein
MIDGIQTDRMMQRRKRETRFMGMGNWNEISRLSSGGGDDKSIILEGKWKGLQCRFSPLISRIEEDFTDKMCLIYRISGTPNW